LKATDESMVRHDWVVLLLNRRTSYPLFKEKGFIADTLNLNNTNNT